MYFYHTREVDEAGGEDFLRLVVVVLLIVVCVIIVGGKPEFEEAALFAGVLGCGVYVCMYVWVGGMCA